MTLVKRVQQCSTEMFHAFSVDYWRMICCTANKTRRLVQRTVQGKYCFQRYGSGNIWTNAFILIHTVFSLSQCVLVGKMLIIMCKTENKETNSDPENKQSKGCQSNAVNLTNSLTSVATYIKWNCPLWDKKSAVELSWTEHERKVHCATWRTRLTSSLIINILTNNRAILTDNSVMCVWR